MADKCYRDILFISVFLGSKVTMKRKELIWSLYTYRSHGMASDQ